MGFDDDFDKMSKGIFAAWAIGALVWLAMMIVVIWAIVQVVQHVTA